MTSRSRSLRGSAGVALFSLALLSAAAGGADFEVTAPGGWMGDTCGAGNDCSLRTSYDHEYLVHIPVAGNWTFSLCRTNWDTWMAVGETACTIGGGGTWFSDDAPGCEAASKVTINDLPAGDYHVTIEAFSPSGCGPYSLLIYDDQPCLEPACPDGSMLDQPPTTPEGPWELWVSSYHPQAAEIHFESFSVPGEIQGIRWWGLLTGVANAACHEDPIDFVVQFYTDDGAGHPDFLNPHSVYELSMQPTYHPCVYNDYMLLEFSADLDPPCALPAGWVSVGGDGALCSFHWISSEEGDGVSLHMVEQFGQPVWTTHDHDRSLCLAGGCAGDINGDGVVNVLDLLAVLAAWGPCSGTCPEDLNADGVVNVLDLLAVLAAWGPCA